MEKKRILIVENDLDIARTLVDCFNISGFCISQFQSLNSILLEENNYRSNLMLIGIDSLENVEEIKKKRDFFKTLNTPILLLSNDEKADLSEIIEITSPFAILPKNFSESILLSSVNIALRLNQKMQEQQEKERKLTENVELMQNILDCSADFIFVKDRNLRTILCNEMVAKAVGRKASDLIGHNDIENGVDIELVKGNPEKGIRGYENDDLAALGGETLNNPADLVYTDGKVYVFDTVKRPLRNRDGEIIGLLGISRDITERKNSDRLLASERERLAVTLHSIGDGVISTDTVGKISMFNKAAQELTGWDATEAIGMPLPNVFKIVDQISRTPLENPIEKIIRTRERIELSANTSLMTRAGKELIISYSVDPMLDSENKIIGVVIVFRDMTEKIKLEATIQRNQKLESIGILAGGIAHDFNNLLAGIFGYLEIALMYSKDHPRIEEYLNKSLSAFNRAKALTLQLLTFSKGGAPIKKMVRLTPILKASIQFSLSGSNISVQYDLEENLWMTEIDENQISQVIDNIALNAQQAMPDGGTLVVKAENVWLKHKEFPLDSNQSFIKVSFQDDGVGIQREILPRIFDPFFSTKTKGTGLGLTTAFSIIKRHSGFFDVESVQGIGTTFIIYLPAQKGKEARDINFHESIIKGKARILIMDDEDYLQEIESVRLENMGYEVILAKHGDEAIQRIKEAENAKKEFHLFILDLTIPGGKGGIQTLEEIRKINTKTPAIIASGYSESPAISDPTKFGFVASLKKPYSKDELLSIFEKLSL